jgi:hypothetical protein
MLVFTQEVYVANVGARALIRVSEEAHQISIAKLGFSLLLWPFDDPKINPFAKYACCFVIPTTV